MHNRGPTDDYIRWASGFSPELNSSTVKWGESLEWFNYALEQEVYISVLLPLFNLTLYASTTALPKKSKTCGYVDWGQAGLYVQSHGNIRIIIGLAPCYIAPQAQSLIINTSTHFPFSPAKNLANNKNIPTL